MPFFSSSRRNAGTTSTTHRRHNLFGHKDRDRVAGGYKAALANPNTTRDGRRRAKWELRRMGRGNEAHVSLMTKIKRTLGIRSTPRTKRERVRETVGYESAPTRRSGRSGRRRFF
ncbi:hypothetical protein BV25DRAFT_112401 [Artomyces pyxidatus]|uniref:Uncharacterized protein n=1 Tax=Artomyces pyxidatus TaxID=48021 RepID=A0ACB8TL70_9AGAM|nr:hypothetical protein BV25DRAFT_112401 [Artomyces pyxidatus]